METKLYFAYGSNMNLKQMAYRCPKAQVLGRAVLTDYSLIFRGNSKGNGVASIQPEKGARVEGVLWAVTPLCQASLDLYEGYPHLYGKEEISVHIDGKRKAGVEVYVMTEPYQSQPAMPSWYYLQEILNGCRDNGISEESIWKAVERTKQELVTNKKQRKHPDRGPEK